MSIDPNAPLRAAVLSATLTFEPPPADALDLPVPVIRYVLPRTAAALDLEAAYYRYRIDRDGTVHILPAMAGARICREKSRSHRLRSAARS